MTEEQQSNSDANENKPEGFKSTQQVQNIRHNQPEGQLQNTGGQNIEEKPDYVVSNIPEKKEKIWTLANKLTAIGIGVDVVLIMFTFLLFTKTVEAVAEAIRANDISKSQFEIGNRPLLRIADIEVYKVAVGQNPDVSFNILNLGKYPAIISTGFYDIEYFPNPRNDSTIVDELEKRLSKQLEQPINRAVDERTNEPISFSSDITLPESIAEEMNRGEMHFYLYGRFTYRGFVTDSSFSYSFIYKYYGSVATSKLLKEKD